MISEIKVLDHGFVCVVDKMGDDHAIAAAARCSTGKQDTIDTKRDEQLIRYLVRNNHCYSEDTEVLAKVDDVIGFFNIKLLRNLFINKKAIELFAVNPNNDSEGKFEKPKAFFCEVAPDRMYRVSSMGIDLLVTDNHSMIVKTVYSKEWERRIPLEIYNKSCISFKKSTHYVGTIQEIPNNPFKDNVDLFAAGQLIGFFIGDGFSGGTSRNHILFHLKKKRKLEYLSNICKNIEVVVDFKSNAIVRIENAREWFSQFYDESGDKIMPCWILEMPIEFRLGVLDGLKNSDGSIKRTTWNYSTMSKKLAHNIQTMASLTGTVMSLNESTVCVNGKYYNKFVLNCCKRSATPTINKGHNVRHDSWIDDFNLDKQRHVYCPTVSTGCIIVRRNNKIVVCGNSSPLEMCELKLNIKLPIFVMRQWIRHRTANVNEFSMRYSEAPEEYYVPELINIREQCSINKQGSAAPVHKDVAEYAQTLITDTSCECFNTYKNLLDNGVSRETARMVLPVNFYTQMYWKCDLRNIFNFLKLRLDSHAQFEIRVYAQAIAQIVREWCPIAYKAFEDFVLNTSN